jgi:hypothetical protein
MLALFSVAELNDVYIPRMRQWTLASEEPKQHSQDGSVSARPSLVVAEPHQCPVREL